MQNATNRRSAAGDQPSNGHGPESAAPQGFKLVPQTLSCPRCHANWAFYPAEAFMSVRSKEWCGWCERAGVNELVPSKDGITPQAGKESGDAS